jgi:hypothetical protein
MAEIGRDSLGFEDIDEFWNADGTVTLDLLLVAAVFVYDFNVLWKF